MVEVKAPDGKTSCLFGEKPKGILVFTLDGHFTQIDVAGGRGSASNCYKRAK